MATVTDDLVTVFELQGLSQYVLSVDAAAGSLTVLAAAEDAATVSGAALAAEAEVLTGALKILAAALAAVAAVGLAGTKQFAEDEDQLFRTALAFKNLGSSVPFSEIVRFSDALHQAVAVDDEDLVELAGTLRRIGVDGRQLEPTLAAIADFAQGTGRSLQEAATQFESALVGRGLAIKREGANFKATGDRIQDVIALTKELNRLFAGAGEARFNTPLGQIEALKIAFGDFFSAVGNVLSGIALPALQAVVKFIQEATAAVEHFGRSLGIRTTAEQAAAAAGLKGDPEQTKLQGEIADNTRKTANALDGVIKQAFGGSGAVGQQAGSIRALGAALRTGARAGA